MSRIGGKGDTCRYMKWKACVWVSADMPQIRLSISPWSCVKKITQCLPPVPCWCAPLIWWRAQQHRSSTVAILLSSPRPSRWLLCGAGRPLQPEWTQHCCKHAEENNQTLTEQLVTGVCWVGGLGFFVFGWFGLGFLVFWYLFWYCFTHFLPLLITPFQLLTYKPTYASLHLW